MPISSIAKRNLSLPSGFNFIPTSSNLRAVSLSTPIPPESRTSIAIYFTVSGLTLGSGETARVRLQNLTSQEGLAEESWSTVGELTSPFYVEIDQNGRYGYLLDSGIQLEALIMPVATPVRLVASTGPATSMYITDVLIIGAE